MVSGSGEATLLRPQQHVAFQQVCADANAYHTFMSSVHGPKIILFIFHSSVINMVFTSSWSYPRLTRCCRGELQYYERCDKTRNFLYTSFPLGQLQSHKMDNDKNKGSSVGNLLTHKSSVPSLTPVYVKSICPFLYKGAVTAYRVLFECASQRYAYKAKVCSLHVPVSLTPFKSNVQMCNSFWNQAFGSSTTHSFPVFPHSYT